MKKYFDYISSDWKRMVTFAIICVVIIFTMLVVIPTIGTIIGLLFFGDFMQNITAR